MAPKRTAHRESSPPPAATSSDEAYSSGEEEEEQEEVRLASPSPLKKNTSAKHPINSSSPIPQTSKPSRTPAAAAASSDDVEEEESSEDDEEDDAGKEVEKGGEEKEEEKEEEEDEGEDEDSSEDEPPPRQSQSQPKQPLPQPKLTSTEPESSTDDSGSESSDEEPASSLVAVRPSRTADSSIKPISSKPMDELKAIRSPASSVLSQGKESHKRKLDESVRSELDNGGAGQKRQLFQRKWTLDDEIAILQGLAQYRAKNNALPSTANDMVAFYDFVRGSLQSELNKNQVIDKLRRLKKKFATCVARSKKSVDLDPHEQKLYELSMKVWGVQKAIPTSKVVDSESEESDDESERKIVGNKKSIEMQLDSRAVSKCPMIMVNGENAKSQFLYPYLSQLVDKIADENPCGVALKRSLEILDNSKAKVVEEKVKQLKLKEMKQNFRRMDLVKETVKVIVDAVGKPE